jgi:hypothetical protein
MIYSIKAAAITNFINIKANFHQGLPSALEVQTSLHSTATGTET